MAPSGQVVVPVDGPYPPQCNGGGIEKVHGSRGDQFKPRVWSLQKGVDEEEHITIFSKTLMRPLKFKSIEDVELTSGTKDTVMARKFELVADGLKGARIAFNCADIFRNMAEAGVLNRGSVCDSRWYVRPFICEQWRSIRLVVATLLPCTVLGFDTASPEQSDRACNTHRTEISQHGRHRARVWTSFGKCIQGADFRAIVPR